MADLNTASKSRRTVSEEASPLDALSRTLEDLEQRLSRMQVGPRGLSSRMSDPHGFTDPAPRRTMSRHDAVRPTLSSAVSQIALRQKALDADGAVAGGLGTDRPARNDKPSSARARSATGDQGSFSDVSRELERLREELRRDTGRENEAGLRSRLDEMRAGFDDLRQMIGERASAEAIEAEMARLGDGLDALMANGVDRQTMQSLKEELSAMGDLVGQMAREETVRAVGQRWDVFESKMSGRADADDQSRRDLKDEMERLRASIGSLASEDHVSAVERRLDQFEAMFANAPRALDEAAIADILKAEMSTLREKLETLASEKSMRAVEERWGAMEDRFASRDIETKIEAMAARIGQIETALEKLPETLSIGPLEQRVHALAVGIEALARRQEDESDSELDQFAQLEERLDEISRAIVNASARAPAFDMSPIDRIEARLQTLANRIDEVAEGGETDFLTQQIVELSERIEAMSNDPQALDLAERIERFSGHLETLVANSEAASAGTGALELRLEALAGQIDDVSHMRVDEAMVKSLEAQIARLSQLIGEGGATAALVDPELDARLGEIERRLDENRDSILVSARAAADEAVRRMLESGDLRQSEHVARLTEGLKALEDLSRETGTQSQEFFGAVHSTLQKLVDRIGLIESEIKPGRRPRSETAQTQADEDRSARVEAAVFSAFSQDGEEEPAEKASGLRSMLGQMRRSRQAPTDAGERGEPQLAAAATGLSELGEPMPRDIDDDAPSLDAADILDSHEANRPLAIGSGAPNITALLDRVRAQQAGRAERGDGEDIGKADFIAAARRAAMAAAAEADSLRSDGDEAAGGKRRLRDILARRRQPVLMAIGAVILVLMALPLGQTLLSSPDSTLSDEAVVADDEPAAVVEIPSPEPASPAATTTASTQAAPDTTSGAAENDAPAPQTAAERADESPYISPTGLASSTLGAGPAAPAAGFGEARSPSKLRPLAKLGPLVSPAALEPSVSAPTTSTPDVSAAGAAAAAMEAAAVPAMPETVGSPALKTAVSAADPKALFEVGLRLMEGRSTAPAPDAAAKWFAASATRGFAPAQYSLGTLYEKGNGVARDTRIARDWYVRAADQGNVRAMHNLAVLYATGVDGKSAPALAAQWFEKAAAHGMTDSQYNLGILYARGAGVPQNLEQSYKWFSIVAAGGDKDSATKRDEIGKSMTPEQLKTAEAAVQAFAPLPRDEAANTVDIPADWADKIDPVQTSSVDMKKAVRNIQAILGKLGYDAGTPDGVIGGQTTKAIQSFQKDAGLTVSGDIDEPLIRALLKRKDS